MGKSNRRLSEDSITVYVPPVWCERCCIRVAPYDKQLIKAKKTFHALCYPKFLRARADSMHQKREARLKKEALVRRPQSAGNSGLKPVLAH